MKNTIRPLQIFALSTLCLGFHIYPGGVIWNIDKTDPTIWIRSCSDPSISDPTLPSGDPLTGSTSLTYSQLLSSVMDDYNNIQTSYIRLAKYPTDPSAPGTPAPGDSTFTTTKGAIRTIDICFANQVLTGGHARPHYVEDKITECHIEINESQVKTAVALLRVLTHEIGHCLGLKHTQDSTKSVMSYFSDVGRLQDDDKMAMTYLYPQEASYAQETATFGLSCQPR